MLILILQALLKPTQLLQNNYCNSVSKTTLMQLKAAQYYALATDADVVVTQYNEGISIDTNETILNAISFINTVSANINRSKGLGFKPNLNSKYAGTLTLHCVGQLKTISFPVGLAVLSIK